MTDTALPLHPFCAMFPPASPGEMQDLIRDIRKNGLRESIVLYQGAILDGRVRAEACINAKVEPHYFAFEGDDKAALAFVLSKNVNRRHLTKSQSAMIAAKLANITHGGDRRSDQSVILSVDAVLKRMLPRCSAFLAAVCRARPRF
jgi:hypothetical protein